MQMVKGNKKLVEKFIAHVKAECKKYKIKFKMSKYNKVHSGDFIMCGGYFDDENKTLAVATGGRTQEQCLALLVHEYNHLLQWANKSKYWCGDSDGFLLWLEGKNNRWNDKKINHHFLKTVGVEWDCERQSVKMIKKWKLPINLKSYIQQANAYVGSYAVMKKKRKWTNRSAYRVKCVVEQMPGDRILTQKEIVNPPAKFTELALRYCF
jgi:hypothetical protein